MPFWMLWSHSNPSEPTAVDPKLFDHSPAIPRQTRLTQRSLTLAINYAKLRPSNFWLYIIRKIFFLVIFQLIKNIVLAELVSDPASAMGIWSQFRSAAAKYRNPTQKCDGGCLWTSPNPCTLFDLNVSFEGFLGPTDLMLAPMLTPYARTLFLQPILATYSCTLF